MKDLLNDLKGPANRRSFMKKGLAAAGTATAGAGLLGKGLSLFGQDSDDGAAAALRLIGLEPTRELVALVREFRAGRCLMRDLAGRVGEVQVDLVYPRLLRAFGTTPGQGQRAAA